MFIEDAREATLAAVRMMDESKEQMGCESARFWTIGEFLAEAERSRLTQRQKEIIVDQAILVLDQLYAHLPFKRARYAVDPVQRLRLIRSQIGEHSDLTFHREMVHVFTRLRDAHTFYGLPRPYRGSFAFLPFRMQCFHDRRGQRRFLVTSVMDGFEYPPFGRHAEITAWNGMPVERAIERDGGYDPLGNEASRFVRGLNRMSNRTLGFSLPPEEDYVVVEYLPRGARPREERRAVLLPWYVATDCLKPVERPSGVCSINDSMLQTVQARKYLWSRAELARERHIQNVYGAPNVPLEFEPEPAEPDLSVESMFPANFEFRHSGGPAASGGVDPASLCDPDHPEKRFGYVRIRSFDHRSSDAFVGEFGRILSILQAEAPDGLIVDIRSNPGGAIDAAERSLSLLTPGDVQPASFHFLNTRLTQQIANSIRNGTSRLPPGPKQAEWGPWVDDLISSVFSGSVITPGRPLTRFALVDDPGQIYQGPVTLLIDALSYSAADLFAAGFQDNGAGPIIGVDDNTGGGGANRWLHTELVENLDAVPGVPLERLPGGAQLGVAFRRSSRAGFNAGNVIEDVGVHRDIAYRITRDDLLHRDRDLLRFACARLAAQPRHGLRIVSAKLESGWILVEVSQERLHRLEFLVNGLPQCSFAAADPQPFRVPTGSLKDEPGLLRVNGFALRETELLGPELRLVVSASVQLESSGEAAA